MKIKQRKNLSVERNFYRDKFVFRKEALFYSDRKPYSIKLKRSETMKRVGTILFLLSFLPILFSAISFSQQVDLSGTWEGTAEVPNAVEPDKMTLILEKKDGQYTGTISDSMGMIQDEELKDVEFKDNKLSFGFNVFTGQEYMPVKVTVTVEQNRMSGQWSTEDGSSGRVELERKK